MKPRIRSWFHAASILPEAQSLLELLDAPNQPIEFDAFLAGLSVAANALSPGRPLRYLGVSLTALAEDLRRCMASGIHGTHIQWHQDSMHGQGNKAYRALAQPAAKGTEAGYGCLKAILLGLTLVRSSARSAVDQRSIERVSRFIRQASRDVHVSHELERRRVVASLPATFIPSQLNAALTCQEDLPEGLRDRVRELLVAVEKLTKSFQYLDLGEPSTAPGSNPSDVSPLGETNEPLATPTKPVRRFPRPVKLDQLDEISAGPEAPDATFVFGPALAPSPEESEALAHNAEAIDDRLHVAETLTLEFPISTSEAVRHTTALRLLSDVRQGFWARIQWDALSPAEMKDALRRYLRELKLLENAPDATRHEAIALGLLSGSTGLPRARCHAIRIFPAQDDDLAADIVDLGPGRLTLPLIDKDARFQPSSEQETWLRVVRDDVPIYLPQEVAVELRRLVPTSDGFLFRSELQVLEDILDSLHRSSRDDEPRFTAARLHRGHQLELLVQCGHPPSVQMLTGQTIGTPPVGLAYYSARTQTLQAIYNRAIARHGMTPSENEESSSSLVGSKLALSDDALASAVGSINRGLVNRPRSRRTNGRELVYLHDELVRAAACLWMAGTSFRPTSWLGEVRAGWINWISGSAVITDKLVDAAHEGRLVPLASTLLQSLGAYGSILDQMTREPGLNFSTRSAARRTLTGEGPLLFLFDKHGEARPLSPIDALSRLPNGWNLPSNFLRHRLATRLREVECPGPYVQALMGHLEQGNHPFGSESFMVPAEYLETTRHAIERVLQEDGWRPLLGGHGDPNIFLDYAPPLGGEVLSLEEKHEQAATSAFQEQRRQVEQLREVMGSEIAAHVEKVVGETLPRLIADPSSAHEIDKSEVRILRVAVCSGADCAATVELRVKALQSFLRQGRELHGWKVKRLPQHLVFQPTCCRRPKTDPLLRLVPTQN